MHFIIRNAFMNMLDRALCGIMVHKDDIIVNLTLCGVIRVYCMIQNAFM